MYYMCMNYMCNTPKTPHMYYMCNMYVAHLLVCYDWTSNLTLDNVMQFANMIHSGGYQWAYLYTSKYFLVRIIIYNLRTCTKSCTFLFSTTDCWIWWLTGMSWERFFLYGSPTDPRPPPPRPHNSPFLLMTVLSQTWRNPSLSQSNLDITGHGLHHHILVRFMDHFNISTFD